MSNVDYSILSFSSLKENANLMLNGPKELLFSSEFEHMVQSFLQDKRKNVQGLGEKLLKEKRKLTDEIQRVKDMYDFDRNFCRDGLIAGADEVGRGPFAGPIVAAAVVLDLKALSDNELILGIKDSKALKPGQREELSKIIKEKALYYNIQEIDNNDIDNIGLAWANNEVLKRAVMNIKAPLELVISDGFLIKGLNLKNEFVIKGDAKSASIACASIIAKVYRDNIMKEYDKEYPKYFFCKNAGYGTADHIQAIKDFGITKIHRKSFLKNIL